MKIESEGEIPAGEFLVRDRATAYVIEVEPNKELDGLPEDLPLWGLVKMVSLQRFADTHDPRFFQRLAQQGVWSLSSSIEVEMRRLGPSSWHQRFD